MPEWCAGRRKTPIGATEYPVELVRKPTGSPHFEYRQWRTSHGAYPFVVIGGNQSFQPVGGGGSIVVEECEHLPARELGPGIASCAKVTVVFICQNGQRHCPCWALLPEIFFALPQQLLIMIDAHDDLDRWCGLSLNRSDRLLELQPAIFCVRADNDRYRRKVRQLITPSPNLARGRVVHPSFHRCI